MAAESHRFQVETRGHNQVLNITDEVSARVVRGSIECGIATVFVIGSTAGITTTEFEPGLANHDLKAAFEAIAPEHGHYRHEETWHDDNGHAHIRAALLGPTLTVPVIDRNLVLGVWQQIVLIDFDTRGRQREVIVQVIGD